MTDKIERLERLGIDVHGNIVPSRPQHTASENHLDGPTCDNEYTYYTQAAARERVLVEAFEDYISASCSGLEETERAGLDDARRVLAEIEETAK